MYLIILALQLTQCFVEKAESIVGVLDYNSRLVTQKIEG